MLNDKQLLSINWKKTNGLLPCIIQNIFSSEILMHGFMNQNALNITQRNKIVTFYSRTKKRLWTKGETSGNVLKVIDIILDCDQDSILILVHPNGKTCHLNTNSCFNGKKTYYTDFFYLEDLLNQKKIFSNESYTSQLHKKGISRIAQKVGEEAVETIISAMNNKKEDIINEASDLIYHLLVLLHNKNLKFNDIIKRLNIRRKFIQNKF